MLELSDLELLISFAQTGTLSRTAENFHISTPSVTRVMKSIEDEFGVPLFVRSKNRIELNDTGMLAVEHAKKLLESAEQAVRSVREYDARKKTIRIRSCAPAPLWRLLRELNEKRPETMISSAICQNEEVIAALEGGDCDVGILPFPYEGEGFSVREYMHEQLYVSAAKTHRLAEYSELSFADINGFNFLLRSELGFWDKLCREKMPSSKFLVQTDAFVFQELVKASSLPCFVTDAAASLEYREVEDRVVIPMTDDEVNVTFYLVSREKDD